jgi:hypothetical protein
MKFYKTFLMVCVVGCLVVANMAFADGVSWKPTSVYIAGFANYSPVSGFVQIPTGGISGSASSERPTFDELGVNNSWFYDLDLGAHWQKFGIYGGYEYNRLNGSNTLSSQLITHGITIPANTKIDTTTKFDWYHLGFSYDFDFYSSRLTLSPEIEFALLNFSYYFKTPAVDSSRAFNAGTIRIGAMGNYRFTPRIALIVDLVTSVPGVTNLNILTATAKLAFDVYQNKETKASLLVGTGITRIDFEDKQTLPNHMRLVMAPMVITGLAVSF